MKPTEPTNPTEEHGLTDNPDLVRALTDGLARLDEVATIYLAAKRSDKRWHALKRTAIVLIVGIVMGFYAIVYGRAFGLQIDPTVDAVALIPIEGAIGPGLEASAEQITPIISRACKATHVHAIALEINSGGGSPSEAEKIIAAVERCRAGSKTHPAKKVYALIDGVGASAAYMIAMHTDGVYAGRYSLVGSIGAIMRLNDASSLANRFGVREVSYRTAPLKGGPSLISGQSEVEAEAMQVLVDEAGKIFLRDVLAQRKGKLKVDESTLYSGNIWTAEQALEMGLIDGVGVLDSLRDTLFEGRDLHRYTTKQSIAEKLGLKSLVQQVLADAQGIRLQ